MTRSFAAVSLVLFFIGCGGERQSAGDTANAQLASSGVDLTGAGATFPYPIYSKWFSDYARQTGVRINYQSIGSGGGIRQLSEGTVDFGASDSPMTDEEMARARGGPVLHVPTVIGAVVVTYNVPGVPDSLRLTGEVIAEMFLGRITRWNDARIAALNPGVSLPASDILIVHRSDGSGTTYVFTDYLAAVSGAWRGGPGRGKEVRWPTGIGAKGNEGVAGQVKQTPGAVGYVELAYARQNRLAVAAVRNQADRFVTPAIESITAAAESAVGSLGPETDYRVSIVNAPGENAYPISSFTWILLYRDPSDAAKAAKLSDFLRWALRDGQQSAPALHYAPLPDALVRQLEARLDALGAKTAA